MLAIIVKAPKKLAIKSGRRIAFNDGVGLVIFTTVFAVAFSGSEPTFGDAAKNFLSKLSVGSFSGAILGLIAHYLISATDDGSLEILLTLTPYQLPVLCSPICYVSGALAMVVAGSWSETGPDKAGFSNSKRY